MARKSWTVGLSEVPFEPVPISSLSQPATRHGRELERRITKRFPDANLCQVAVELTTMAREAADRAQHISRPNIPLRVAQWLLVGCGLTLVT